MRTKYPRTPHLPWSPGASHDDVRLADVACFEGREVVVTEKLDGENTTLYADGLHARSLDSAHHPSRAQLKALHARIAPSLPGGIRICGENLFARHSIGYDDLLGFFYAFSVWDGDRALPWDDTVAFAHARGLPTPRVRYRGPFDVRRLRKLKVERDREEGYVVRTADGFDRADFAAHVAKWVRPSHVQTDAHWMHQPVVPNGLSPRAALWTVRSGGPVGDVHTLVDGTPCPLDPGGLGDRRLAAVLAGCLRHRHRAEALPALAPVLGIDLARRALDLVGLHRLLHQPIRDEDRIGGLRSLARCVDLRALHALAEHTADTDAAEQVRWSRLHAEDARLLDDPVAPFRTALVHDDPDVADYRLGQALDAWVAGRLHSPEEALAATHGMAPTGVLRLLVGPSGSGKSTVAEELPGPVVCLDVLRTTNREDPLSVALADLRRHEGGAVWDATSLTRSQRDLPIGIARRHGCLVELVSVLTPRPVAEARNRARARTVPDAVIDRQWHRIRWPYANEGHRRVWRVHADQ